MNGILIINKEKGYTSHDVVAKVKKVAKTKVGHTGTLDPMATGVLPLLLGEGTKLSKYLIQHDKIYEAKLALGQKTDTADTEGKIVEEKNVNIDLLNENNVKKVLKNLEGKQMQLPPMYSAIKIKGKKLYEYARKNEIVEVPKREIEIYEMQLLNINCQEKTITFKVHCSKGTYIRSLCETIAEKLNTVGYMKELNRIKVGNFTIEDSITLTKLENITQNVITIEQFFKEKPQISLTNQKLSLFLNGVQLTRKEQDEIYRIYDENEKFIGIGIIKNNLLKRDIII